MKLTLHNQLWLCSIIEIVRHTYARCCDTWHYYSLIRKRNAHHLWTDYLSFSKIHEFLILMEHLKFHSFYHRYVQIILFLSDKNLIQNVLDCCIEGGSKNGKIVQLIMIVWLAARAKLLLVGLNKCFFFISQPLKQTLLLLWMALFSYFCPKCSTTTSTFANHPINYEPSVAVRQMHWQLNEMLCCCWSRWIFEVGLENGVSNCLKITNLEHCVCV